MNFKTIFGGIALFSLAGLIMIGIYGVRQQQSTAPRAQTAIGAPGAGGVAPGAGGGGPAIVGGGGGAASGPGTAVATPAPTINRMPPISVSPTITTGEACGPRSCDLNGNFSCSDDVPNLRQIISQIVANPSMCDAKSGRDCSMFDTNGDGTIDDSDVTYCQDECTSCSAPSSSPPFPITPKPTSIGGGGGGSCPGQATGDFDCNGVVDLIDFNIWRNEFLGKFVDKADANNDTRVDLIDFNIWRTAFINK